MRRFLSVLVLAPGLAMAAGAAHAGGRTTHADVHGTKLTVVETAQLSQTLRIRVRKAATGGDDLELVRRMQVVVEGLRGCRFDEASLRRSGADYVAGFAPDCWFYRAVTPRSGAQGS